MKSIVSKKFERKADIFGTETFNLGMLGIISLYVVKFKNQLFWHGASVSDWSDKVSNCEITLHLHAIFLTQAYSFHECKEMG